MLLYLLSPIDLIPDVVPVLGYADDAIVVAIALRYTIRRAGESALRRQWPGTPEGLAVLLRLVGPRSRKRRIGTRHDTEIRRADLRGIEVFGRVPACHRSASVACSMAIHFENVGIAVRDLEATISFSPTWV